MDKPKENRVLTS